MGCVRDILGFVVVVGGVVGVFDVDKPRIINHGLHGLSRIILFYIGGQDKKMIE